MARVKPSHKLTLRDRLSQLTPQEAAKLLGPGGRQFIIQGARRSVCLDRDVVLRGDLLRVTLRTPSGRREAIATLTLAAAARQRLRWNCDQCTGPCEHVGALLATVLESKSLLGLAAPPPEAAAAELSDEELVEQALAERRERARTERMRIRSTNSARPWTDYQVTSLVSGKAYRVAMRGFAAGQSYCECPDYRSNTLGTCKHVMKVAAWVRRRFTARQLAQPYRRKQIEVYVEYGDELTLKMSAPSGLSAKAESIVRPLVDRPIENLSDLVTRLGKLSALGQPYVVYPDAEDLLDQRLHAEHMAGLVRAIRSDPAAHPLRHELLKVPLLPYQLDGIAFAVGAGRAVLADEMGLGKTVQAVGVAELLARETGIGKVLVVCPASLKSQWQSEIARFSGRSAQIVAGTVAQRTAQYDSEAFFTICNYEQVLRDLLSIEQVRWDLIVLDEGQRIKNWEAKTSRVIKALKSRFALVLSGTPLENRLDELYSVVQFIDQRRLGPGFRFFSRHRQLDESGRVVGYQRLDELRARLRPVLLRRTRDSVRLELPERSVEIVRIPPNDEQKTLHDEHMRIVGQIVSKRYLTEMDILRLRVALLMCRLAANGTSLVTKEEPNWSSKLDHLADLLVNLAEEPERKLVIFSEWTSMLDRIEPLLGLAGMEFVRLDGSVPQKMRQTLVHRFFHDEACRVFLSTNAGGTGLNLQAADTVINVDLPWNPAVLDQRIGRAHRMGQKRRVQVYVLVTEETIEERLLATLASKHDLALAALDPDSQTDSVEVLSQSESLKAKLEVLLGARAEAPLDETQRERVALEAARLQSAAPAAHHGETAGDSEATGDGERGAAVSYDGAADAAPRDGTVSHGGATGAAQRERVAAAGGELLGAAFRFLGELVAHQPQAAVPLEPVVHQLRASLDECVEADAEGRPRLTVTLPDRQTIDSLAQTLARLLVAGQGN